MGATQNDISALQIYCKRNGIVISPGICPKRIPGRGLGVYATRPLKRGERIASVPTTAIFTTKNIPASFLSKEERKKLAVHAQIAAFWAFADDAALEKYKPWMATWPEMEDFISTMPLFWGEGLPEALRKGSAGSATNGAEPEEPVRKRRRTGSNDIKRSSRQSPPAKAASPAHINTYLPPGLTSTWQPSPFPSLPSTSPLAQMTTKLATHISSLLPYIPQLTNPTHLTTFLHTWSLTNTRCFYYHPHNAGTAPTDPNECMALMPFLDLFNHSSAPDTCRVRYTSRGFEVTTRRAYAEGEEVEVCYGDHGQDGLWTEYGFMLAGREQDARNHSDVNGDMDEAQVGNRFDKIAFDEIVLADERLGEEEKELLKEHGYFGEYVMTMSDGMCYRTQVAALLIVLGKDVWVNAVIEGGGHDLDNKHGEAVVRAKDVMREWCEIMIRTCQQRLGELAEMGEIEMLSVFATVSCIEERTQQPSHVRLARSTSRKEMCEARWKEIRNTAEVSRAALKAT